MAEPTSIASARVRHRTVAEISPRDLLEDLLNRIDNGEFKPTGMVVAFVEDIPDDEGRVEYTSAVAKASYGVAYVLATWLKKRVWEDLMS